VIEDLASRPAFDGHPVGAQHGEVLRYGGVTDSEHLLQVGDGPFTRPKLEDDAEAMRVGQGTEHVGELFGGQFSMRHDVQMFKSLNT